MTQPTIKQDSCDNYRGQIFKKIGENERQITTMKEQISSMKGAHRLAVIVSPIIVSVILTLGGVAFANYIKSELLELKLEIQEATIIPSDK